MPPKLICQCALLCRRSVRRRQNRNHAFLYYQSVRKSVYSHRLWRLAPTKPLIARMLRSIFRRLSYNLAQRESRNRRRRCSPDSRKHLLGMSQGCRPAAPAPQPDSAETARGSKTASGHTNAPLVHHNQKLYSSAVQCVLTQSRISTNDRV